MLIWDQKQYLRSPLAARPPPLLLRPTCFPLDSAFTPSQSIYLRPNAAHTLPSSGAQGRRVFFPRLRCSFVFAIVLASASYSRHSLRMSKSEVSASYVTMISSSSFHNALIVALWFSRVCWWSISCSGFLLRFNFRSARKAEAKKTERWSIERHLAREANFFPLVTHLQSLKGSQASSRYLSKP